MARVPILALIPPVAFAALAGLFLGGMFRDDPDALPSTLIGQAAPAIDTQPISPLSPLDPDALVAADVKLVNFWASWCAPCRVEHPHLMTLYAEGIPIYGVNYKDDAGNAVAFLDELGDPYTGVGADPRGRTALEWGVYGVPETYVIGADGTVLLRLAGPVTRDVLERRLRPVLDEALSVAVSAEQPDQ